MGPLKGSTRGPLKESVRGPLKGSIRGPLKGSIMSRVLGIKVIGDRVEGLVCGLGFSQMKYASVGDIYIYICKRNLYVSYDAWLCLLVTPSFLDFF